MSQNINQSRAVRNNNPGNLRGNGAWVQAQPGFIGVDDAGFAQFATRSQGMVTLVRLLLGGAYAHLTIPQAIARYAPANENDTANYVGFVLKKSGAPADVAIENLTSGDFCRFLAAICDIED